MSKQQTKQNDDWSNTTESFSVNQLEGSTFRILEIGKEKVSGRNGGMYDAHVILAEIKGYVAPIWVRLPTRDFETLRLLKMQGIKTYSCTLGVKPEHGYAPRIYAGAKDW